jgi:WD40 repeat protein
MADFDHILIQSSRKELTKALAEAASAANLRARERRLAWPPDNLSTFLTEVETTPEGRRQFNGSGPRDRSGQARSVVVLVWWTDRIGRKHHRVVGRRRRCNNSARHNILSPGGDRPPLWLVYPDNLYLRQNQGGWELFAACRCGAVGPPETLGWMADCCGPCHDRREAGEPPPALSWPPHTVLAGHTTEVMNVAYGQGGRLLVSQAMFDASARLWDLEKGECRHLEHGDWLSAAAFSPTDSRLALGRIGAVHIWNAAEDVWDKALFQEAKRIGQRHGAVNALTFSPDGATLAAVFCGFNWIDLGSLAVWDLGEESAASPLDGRRARCIAFSPDGRSLAAGAENQVHLWDLEDGQDVVPVLTHSHRVRALAFSPNGRILATADEVGRIWLWDTSNGRQMTALTIHPTQAHALAFSPDGGTLAAAAADGTLRFWDGAGQRKRAAFLWHCGGVRTVAFSPDGEWLATGGDDDLVKLWPWRRMLGL